MSPRPCPPRLRAFTLLEMLVVLTVSALLFSLAYAALGLVQRQQRAYEARTAALGLVSTWQNALAADLRAARRVEVSGDELRCQRPAGLVVYALRDSILVRQQGEVLDSLPLPVRAGTYFWRGQPRRQGLIDEVSLLLLAARDTFYVEATTHYAAQQLLGDSTTVPLPLP